MYGGASKGPQIRDLQDGMPLGDLQPSWSGLGGGGGGGYFILVKLL